MGKSLLPYAQQQNPQQLAVLESMYGPLTYIPNHGYVSKDTPVWEQGGRIFVGSYDPQSVQQYEQAYGQPLQQINGAQTGGLTPGSAPASGGFFANNPNQISGDMVTWPDGTQSDPMAVPPGVEPWQPGQPVTPPPNWPPYTPNDPSNPAGPINYPVPGGPVQPGGGPVAPGGPTGQGPGPVFTNPANPGLQPGASAFDRMIAQLPPDMQRIVLGDPAMVEALQQLVVDQSQSVDQLGGANSAFFQNMMGQLAPAFGQRRAEGLAAAKEASGNLTGSGYANALGGSINRSLGEEQATLADYASRGMQTEVARQLQQAGLNLEGGKFNIGTEAQRRGFNADAVNRFIQQQAGIDQDRIRTQYGAGVSTNQLNANNYLQSIMGILGGQKNDVLSQGGIGSFLGPLLSALPYILPLIPK